MDTQPRNGTLAESLQHLPQWPARKIVAGTLVVAAVAAAFVLVLRLHVVVFSLFSAIVISTAIAPGVEWLNRRGVPRALGVGLIYAGLLLCIGVVTWLLVPVLAEQGATIAATFGGFWTRIIEALRLSPSMLIRRLAWQLPGDVSMTTVTEGVSEGVAEGVAAEAMPTLDAVARALAYLGLAAESVFLLLAVLLLAFYWTLDRGRVLRSALLLVPAGKRDTARDLFVSAEVKVGQYIRGVALLCVLVGALALVVFVLMGLPYALLLALAVGLFEAVPLVGPALGALPAVLVALAFDPALVPWVVVAMAAIQFVENTVLVPRVMGRTVGVNPVVTLLALLAFGRLFGIPGALLAIPLAAVGQLLLEQYVLGPAAVEPYEPAGRDRLSVLRYEARELAADVRKQIRTKALDVVDESDNVEDQLEALAADLDSFFAQHVPDDDEPAPGDQAARGSQAAEAEAGQPRPANGQPASKRGGRP